MAAPVLSRSALLAAVIDLAMDEAGSGDDDAEEVYAQLTELGGFTSVFCKLANAVGHEHDSLLVGKPTTDAFLAQSLGRLTAAVPNQYLALVQQLDGQKQAHLTQILQQFGVQLR